MRVVQSFCNTFWTRSGWVSDGESSTESVLIRYPLRKILLAASVTSWIVYAPNYERVLYVDQENYDVLRGWNWLSLWHRVEIVNFAEKLKGITFYASSKPFTWTLQSEPFWSVDLDCYLKQPIDPDWFDPAEWWGETYKVPITITPKEVSPGIVAESSAMEWYSKYYPIARGTYLEKLDRMQAVNAGMVFCPNADQANLIGLATLELMRLMSRHEWNTGAQVIEEVPLGNWIPVFGKTFKSLRNNTFYHHHYLSDKDHFTLQQKTVDKIVEDLGYEPVSTADKLAALLKVKKTTKML